MARSSVTLETYRSEILHECDEVELSEKFPPGLINKWIHKDLCETILRLGGVINHLYRATASLAVTSGNGWFDPSVSHTAAETSVSGFSGLTPDDWIGGSAVFVDAAAEAKGTIYTAQITDNDATTITISNGADLPAITTKPMMLTKNNAGSLIVTSSLSMINFADPFWKVVTDAGVQIPKMNSDLAVNISNIPQYDNKTYYYIVGQNIQLALGSGATASGTWVVGYYVLPTEATADSDSIDFPLEYHTLAQAKTIIRVMKKKGMVSESRVKEADLDGMFAKFDEANMNMLKRDKAIGERK